MGHNKNFDFPFIKFAKLFSRLEKKFQKKGLENFNACYLATSCNNLPKVRTVLLKSFDTNGFVFYTNINSAKGLDIKNNPNVSILFHWPDFKVQVRITGRAHLVEDSVADSYFASRAYMSKIGAWASKQSQIMPSLLEFIQRILKYQRKYENEVPRPLHWSGFIVVPESFEFWCEKSFRLHTRKYYSKSENNSWQESLLYP